MKFRNLPAIITLIAGLIVCVLTIIREYEIQESLWILIVVMVIFYVIGWLLRLVINKIITDEENKKREREELEAKEKEALEAEGKAESEAQNKAEEDNINNTENTTSDK